MFLHLVNLFLCKFTVRLQKLEDYFLQFFFMIAILIIGRGENMNRGLFINDETNKSKSF